MKIEYFYNENIKKWCVYITKDDHSETTFFTPHFKLNKIFENGEIKEVIE